MTKGRFNGPELEPEMSGFKGIQCSHPSYPGLKCRPLVKTKTKTKKPATTIAKVGHQSGAFNHFMVTYARPRVSFGCKQLFVFCTQLATEPPESHGV